jgi:hypothetical protein
MTFLEYLQSLFPELMDQFSPPQERSVSPYPRPEPGIHLSPPPLPGRGVSVRAVPVPGMAFNPLDTPRPFGGIPPASARAQEVSNGRPFRQDERLIRRRPDTRR